MHEVARFGRQLGIRFELAADRFEPERARRRRPSPGATADAITAPISPASRPPEHGVRGFDRLLPILLLQIDDQHAAGHHPQTAADVRGADDGSDDSTPMNSPPSNAGWCFPIGDKPPLKLGDRQSINRSPDPNSIVSRSIPGRGA